MDMQEHSHICRILIWASILYPRNSSDYGDFTNALYWKALEWQKKNDDSIVKGLTVYKDSHDTS